MKWRRSRKIRVRSAAKGRGLTRKAFAEAEGISVSTINWWVRQARISRKPPVVLPKWRWRCPGRPSLGPSSSTSAHTRSSIAAAWPGAGCGFKEHQPLPSEPPGEVLTQARGRLRSFLQGRGSSGGGRRPFQDHGAMRLILVIGVVCAGDQTNLIADVCH
jgi:hypothetical protein